MSGGYRRRKRRVPIPRLKAEALTHLHALGCTCGEVRILYGKYPTFGEVSEGLYLHDDGCPLVDQTSIQVIQPGEKAPR